MQAGEIVYDVEIGTRELLRGEQAATQALDNIDKGAQRVDRSGKGATSSLSGLARAIKAVIAAAAVRELAGWVQQYQTMAERVRMATDSVGEFDLVQRRLQATADGTYRALSEAQELYIRTADSLKALGYETSEALDITDSMSYAFVTNAASADRAAAATSAFAKSMNTGKVAADQWETITSAIPSVIEDIAEASGRTSAEVRALGAAGKLTARDLSEGLRKSLEENKAAADDMATDLIDASVRVRNAITVTLASMEAQTGAIQTFTDGVIGAAEALLVFGADAEKMASFLQLVETAAASVAAVIAGRLVSAMYASTTALYQNTIAARSKAASELEEARTAAISAAQNLVKARAIEYGSRATTNHAATVKLLQAAETTATAATARLAAANTAMAGSFSVATAAAHGLRTALTFLGGPAGIVLLVAAAFVTMRNSAADAARMTELLTGEVKDLSAAQRELLGLQLTREIEAQRKEIERTYRIAATAGRTTVAAIKQGMAELPVAAQAAVDTATQNIDKLEKRLQQLGNMNIPAPRRSSSSDDGAPAATGEQAKEFQKLEQSLRNQIELAKRTGLARAELSALQRLGAEATDEERARITELVGELYHLEQAQKAAEDAERERIKSSEDAQRAAQENVDVLEALREQLYQTTLQGAELAQRQAELSLNAYATPEQVEQVRALAGELYRAQQEAAELERRRSAFGNDVEGAIRGQVDPLQGGRFDDGTERYEAERVAEERRYAEQMERLAEAEALKLEVQGGYDKMREDMYREHVARMEHIDKVRRDAQLDMWSSGFGQMATDLQAFAKVFASENSAMFKVAQAAAIAQTIIDTYKGAQAAFTAMAGIPIVGPALGAAAAAAAVGAGMARVASIRSQNVSGRMYGGAVDPSRMYRINEGGAPEVFNAANGMQYMLPNQRGEVVSNRDASASPVAAPASVVIHVHEAEGTRVNVSTERDDERQQEIVRVVVQNLLTGGEAADAVNSITGTTYQGS